MSAEMMLLAIVAAVAVAAGLVAWIYSTVLHVKEKHRREEHSRRLAQRPLNTRFRERKYH